MPLSQFEENFLFSTVRISITKTVDQQEGSVGTGFIVRIAHPDNPEASGVFLVSNRHVFGKPENTIHLSFTKKKANELKPDIGNIYSVFSQNFSGIYTGHPNPNIDLACINMSYFAHPAHGLYFRHYLETHFSSLAEESLMVGSEVLFIGYPDNRYDKINHVPILRKGCIASAPKLDFNGEKQFLIDAQVFPGSSGSPVFAPINNEYKIVGVVAATMIKNEQLQTIPTGTALGVQQVIGLGIVLKIELLKELLELAISKTDIKNTIEQANLPD